MYTYLLGSLRTFSICPFGFLPVFISTMDVKKHILEKLVNQNHWRELFVACGGNDSGPGLPFEKIFCSAESSCSLLSLLALRECFPYLFMLTTSPRFLGKIDEGEFSGLLAFDDAFLAKILSFCDEVTLAKVVAPTCKKLRLLLESKSLRKEVCGDLFDSELNLLQFSPETAETVRKINNEEWNERVDMVLQAMKRVPSDQQPFLCQGIVRERLEIMNERQQIFSLLQRVQKQMRSRSEGCDVILRHRVFWASFMSEFAFLAETLNQSPALPFDFSSLHQFSGNTSRFHGEFTVLRFIVEAIMQTNESFRDEIEDISIALQLLCHTASGDGSGTSRSCIRDAFSIIQRARQLENENSFKSSQGDIFATKMQPSFQNLERIASLVESDLREYQRMLEKVLTFFGVSLADAASELELLCEMMITCTDLSQDDINRFRVNLRTSMSLEDEVLKLRSQMIQRHKLNSSAPVPRPGGQFEAAKMSLEREISRKASGLEEIRTQRRETTEAEIGVLQDLDSTRLSIEQMFSHRSSPQSGLQGPAVEPVSVSDDEMDSNEESVKTAETKPSPSKAEEDQQKRTTLHWTYTPAYERADSEAWVQAKVELAKRGTVDESKVEEVRRIFSLGPNIFRSSIVQRAIARKHFTSENFSMAGASSRSVASCSPKSQQFSFKLPLDRIRELMQGGKTQEFGLSRANLESHLHDDDFQTAFGVDKTTFYNNPLWKQNKLKQAASLF